MSNEKLKPEEVRKAKEIAAAAANTQELAIMIAFASGLKLGAATEREKKMG